MKKIIIALVFYYSLFITHYSLSQWVWQNPYPVGNPLRGIKFLNENTGIAVGFSENILRTTDGGNIWTLQDLGLNFNRGNIYSVSFINSQTGWIAGIKWLNLYNREGLIYKTTNGGLNWYKPTNDTLFSLYGAQFLNAQTGFAFGYNNYGPSPNQRIYKTTNGGINWTYTAFTQYTTLYNLFFINENTGFISHTKTTDGGVTWAQFLTSNDYISSNFFINSLTGWAIDGYHGKIYKTTNTGINWTMYKVDTTKHFNSVEFTDANTGWVYGEYGIIYKSTNGGVNWSYQYAGTGISLYASCFLNLSKGWIAGDDGKIVKTTDGGNSWTTPSETNNFYFDLKSISIVNSNYAWTAGSNGAIIKTTNGGTNWNYYLTGNTSDMHSVFFVNQNTGFAGSRNGYLLRTTNGGANWNSKSIDTSNHYIYTFPVYFINEMTGWSGTNNYIWKTTNSGINWNSYQIYPSFKAIASIYFINPNTGFVGGYEGFFAKTTNGGVNWYLPYAGTITVENFNSIYFVNEQTGWIAVNHGYIYKTTNSGVNWATGTYTDAENYLYSIKFVNDLTGWCAGMYGTILKTTNGGTNWISQYSGTANHLYSINFIDNATGYVCGQGNTILKTTNGGNVFVKTVSTEIPKNFNLSQNYPNPFNPTTSIKYQVESTKQIKLSVYDILGKEVAVLVNEKQSPGTYEVTFDGTVYPSGIYFYTLETQNYRNTKKMLMIK